MDDKINVLLVEDEHWSRDLLKGYIESRQELELKDVAVDGNEAFRFLDKNRYDLVFLDINLPGKNGIEVLNSLSYLPNIILITVKKDFALKAFELGVVDYLLKPISMARFNTAVDRAVKMRGVQETVEEKEAKTLKDGKNDKHELGEKLLKTLIQEYGLTPQEATICIQLTAGSARDDIIETLSITKQTMKQHLRVIYSKTIDVDRATPNKSHGKLHILMNFLHKLANESGV